MKKILLALFALCLLCPSEALMAQDSSSKTTSTKQTSTKQTSTKQNTHPRIYSRSKVYTLLGYLHVFPNELGAFESEPTDVIRRINAQELHEYNTWRLPTEQEITILKANGYAAPDDKYMTQESRRGRVVLVTDSEKAQVLKEREAQRLKSERDVQARRQGEERRKRAAETQMAQIQARQRRLDSICAQEGFVDLGLESGTLWRPMAEPSSYSFSMANMLYPSAIPSVEQWRELYKECTWEKLDNGYIVTGKNHRSIFIARGDYNSSTIDEANTKKSWIFMVYSQCRMSREYWGRDWYNNILVTQGNNTPTVLAVENELYRDLGLPSGTKWADRDANIHNHCQKFNYLDQVKGIPTKEQWEELKKYCKWEWKDYGYKVTGPNGNYIFLSMEVQNSPEKDYDSERKLCMQYAYCADRTVLRVSIDNRKRIKFDRRYDRNAYSYKYYVCLRRVK